MANVVTVVNTSVITSNLQNTAILASTINSFTVINWLLNTDSTDLDGRQYVWIDRQTWNDDNTWKDGG